MRWSIRNFASTAVLGDARRWIGRDEHPKRVQPATLAGRSRDVTVGRCNTKRGAQDERQCACCGRCFIEN